MSYARIVGGVVQAYPYTLDQLRQAYPETSFPIEMPDERLAEFNVFSVAPTAKPAPSNPVTKNVVQGTPVLLSGVWTQVWIETDASAAEVTQRQRDETDTADKTAVNGDSFVAQFIAMTPAQVANYIDTNVTNIATAKVVLTKIAQMLLLLARREFR